MLWPSKSLCLSVVLLFARYVGESEQLLRRLFTEACRNAPSLMLLDEIDALCPHQRSSHNDIEQRVAACMCSQLDAIVICHSV